jgi:hypothetical protein
MKKKYWSVWVLFALLTGSAIGLWQFAEYRSIRTHAIEHLQNLSTSKQTALQAQLNSAVVALKEAVAYTSHANDATWNVETANQVFADITQKNPAIITLLMINANGMSVASNRPTLIGGNFKNTARFKAISEHPDQNRIYISEPFSTPLGNYTIALGAMLPNKNGGFGGYILAIAAPAFFSEILSQETSEYNVASALIHESGFVIFRVPDSDDRETSDLRAFPDSAFWKFLKQGSNDYLSIALVPSTGLNNIVSYRHLVLGDTETDHQLFLGLSIETDFLYEEWQQLGLELFAAWVLIVGLAGLFVAWKTQRLDD